MTKPTKADTELADKLAVLPLRQGGGMGQLVGHDGLNCRRDAIAQAIATAREEEREACANELWTKVVANVTELRTVKRCMYAIRARGGAA